MDLGYFGPTEGQVLYMITNLIAAFYGPDWWLQETQLFGYTYKYNAILFVSVSIGACGAILINILKVNEIVIQDNIPYIQPIVRFLPGLLVCGLAFIWAYFSPTDILNRHPHIFMITIGLIYCSLVGRIILARMTKAQFLLWHLPMLPLVVTAANAVAGGIIDEELLLYLYFIFTVITYLHFVLTVIRTLCNYLQINALTIPNIPLSLINVPTARA